MSDRNSASILVPRTRRETETAVWAVPGAVVLLVDLEAEKAAALILSGGER